MEEKRQEIRNYIKDTINPVIQPMVKEIIKKRPNDLIKFIFDYANQKMNEAKPDISSESEEEQSEQEKEFLKKLQEKKKKKLGKKISRQGISAEVFGQFNKKSDFKPKVVPKDKDTSSAIQKLIEKSILFQSLNREDLNIVVNAMQEINTTPDEYIITEGEKGDILYVVSSGEYDCSKVIGGKETYLKTYKAGEAFGELALMYNAPRAATIKCKVPGKLYGLDRSTFTNIVQEAAIKKRKTNLQILSKVDIFADIDPYEKEQICDSLKQEEFDSGDYIVQQGDNGDRFYIVAEGKLIAEKSENGQGPKKVFEYKDGDYFGEIALVKNTVRQASIKAETYCRVVSIDRQAFKRLLGPLEQILKRNMDKYRKYLEQH